MSDFVNDLVRRRQEQAARELADAKRAALAAGKEPFEIGKLDALLSRSTPSSAAKALELEENYYIVHAKVRTLAEFAEVVRKLAVWE